MLTGYPPWYRESFFIRAGINLPFPLGDQRDISRGDCIIAFGLMNRRCDSQAPLSVYRCPDELTEPGWRENGRTFRMAIVRCRDHIIRHILPHFEQDINVHIRGSDCRFVMQNFNDYKPLDGGQRDRFQAILLPVMAAAVQGAYEVVQCLKDTGVELKIPPELENLDQEIYLRGCG